MRVSLRTLALLALCVGTVFADNDSQYANRTFLMPRPTNVDKAMEWTTWHAHFFKKHQEKHGINSHFQVTGFWQASTNDEDLGTYFGIGNGKNSFVVGDPTVDGVEINSFRLIHNADGGGGLSDPFPGTITFKPERESFGFRLDYIQDINAPIKNLFFKASMPIVHVETDMEISVADSVKQIILDDPNNTEYTIADFFAGNINVSQNPMDNTNQQESLKFAKINGDRSKTGIADLDLALGYKYFHSATSHAFISVFVTVPTGSKVRGTYLFEPIVGNGHHVALGASVYAGAQVWSGEQGKLRVDGCLNYSYLFEGTEQRTIGVKNITTGNTELLGFYNMGARIGQVDKPFFPLANVLTRDLRVQPNSQIDALLNLSFQSKRFIVEVGYNLYWKDQESIWVKNTDDLIGQVGIVSPTAVSNVAITAASFVGGAAFTADNLDINAAKTPSQITHKLSAGLAFKYKINNSYPSSLGIGGSYEFAPKNSSVEQYAVWGKAGFSF
ncbi:hypothetical protein K2X40_02790 [Candidatus Babeliales bacterium]|nr:hypothetical protein [Candidatus Babeliales bacterium]